jgi:hypothetical protein
MFGLPVCLFISLNFKMTQDPSNCDTKVAELLPGVGELLVQDVKEVV